MFKKIFWIVVALFILVIIFTNTHEVSVNLFSSEPADLKLALIIVLSFFAGIVTILMNNFIDTSEQFFSDVSISSKQKKKKKLTESFKEAEDLIEIKNYKKAKKLLHDYIKEDYQNIDVYLLLSELYQKEGNRDDAIETLRRAVVISKDDVGVLERLARLYAESNNIQKAVKIYTDIREKVSDKTVYTKKIFDVYFAKKDYSTAHTYQVELEKEGYVDDVAFKINKYNLALDMIKRGKHAGGEKHLKGIIKKDKNFYAAYVDYARSLIDNDRSKEALEFLESSFEETRFAYLAKMIEEISLNKDNPEFALSFYQKQLQPPIDNEKSEDVELARQNVQLFALYINLLLKLEMIDFAVDAMNDIIGTDDEKQIFHLFLGECYLRHQKFEASSRAYHKYLSNSDGFHPLKMRCTNCDSEYNEFVSLCTKCDSYNSVNYYIT